MSIVNNQIKKKEVKRREGKRRELIKIQTQK